MEFNIPGRGFHHGRYFGVLAPNAPLRAAVTALAPAAAPTPLPDPPAAEPAHRRAARYAWALLLARIYEVFPLVCARCGSEMRIIAFLTDPAAVRAILAHLGEPTAPPRIAPARGPPLWDLPDAGADHCHPHAQPAPEYEAPSWPRCDPGSPRLPVAPGSVRTSQGAPDRPSGRSIYYPLQAT